MKSKTTLHKVTIYLTAEEYVPLKALAEDEGVTLSAVLRAKLGLAYKRRGAPLGMPIAAGEQRERLRQSVSKMTGVT